MQDEQGFLPNLGIPSGGRMLSKKAFADLVGVTPGRVSQMIADGLPVEANGKIDIDRGRAWISENVDENRRRAMADFSSSASHSSPRMQRELATAHLAKMKAEKLAGSLIDRKGALRAVEARARAEKDSWIGWVNRVAPEIALATGADPAIVTALLDRLVRDQIKTLSETPIERLQQ